MHFVLCLFLSCSPSLSDTGEASKRFVVVTTQFGFGSGVVVKTGYVLTNYHLVSHPANLMVDHYMTSIVAVDRAHDLALLRTTTRKLGQLKLEPGKVGDRVVAIGNPLGHKGLVSHGMVNYVDHQHYILDTLSMNGMSGSGVFKGKKMIALNAAMEGNSQDVGLPMAVAIPSEIIAKFLKENLK